MRYLEYLFGQRVSFLIADRASPQQVADRLRPQIKSRFWPFHFEEVVGRVSDERLSIEWHGSGFSTNMMPRLSGRLVSAGSATRFDGRFGARRFTPVFLVIWTLFDLTFLIAVLTTSLQGKGDGAPLFVFPFLLIHWAFPFAITAIGTVGADKLKNRLVTFVINTGSGRRADVSVIDGHR